VADFSNSQIEASLSQSEDKTRARLHGCDYPILLGVLAPRARENKSSRLRTQRFPVPSLTRRSYTTPTSTTGDIGSTYDRVVSNAKSSAASGGATQTANVASVKN
jgi:hypothetical protein